MVNFSDLNPFDKFNIGLGTVGNISLLVFIVIAILGLAGGLIWWKIDNKKYKFIIPLYKTFKDGTSIQIGLYKAKAVSISLAGDTLWLVKGLNRFIAPATLTDAPYRYPHEEREDGEWINFAISSVNEEQKKAGVKFIHQDMRSQRVATGQLLEQRLLNKGFWDKYKDLIVQIIFYFITVMFMIIIFWQWGNVVDRVTGLIASVQGVAENIQNLECVREKEDGIIPTATALIPLIFWRMKKWEW